MILKLKSSKIEDKPPKTPVYCIKFEEYLKPKSVNKNSKPLLFKNKNNKKLKKPELTLKLLQHPVLKAGEKSKLKSYKQSFGKIFKSHKNPVKKFSKLKKCHKTDNIRKIATKWHNKTFRKPCRFGLGNIKLPKFLAFLRARNDDGLCKRKSGFEIYCEMASIHGFINFVGATTWQRAFWCFVVFLAVTLSGTIVLLSHFMNADSPTILYTESTQRPRWSIPFPAITICNLNRISKRKAVSLAERFHQTSNISVTELTQSFRLALFATENIQASPEEYQQLTKILAQNNFTFSQFVKYLTPNCNEELLRCKWKGRFERCNNLFHKIPTSFGECCAFNYYALSKNLTKKDDHLTNTNLEYTTSCGYKTGLTVLLDPHLDDYEASLAQTSGLQVLVHDSYDLADSTTIKSIITPNSFNKITIIPQHTHATDYINSQKLHSRRCYLPKERKLFYFNAYSQTNCLAECRAALLYEKCQCILTDWPKKYNWTECGFENQECISNYKDIFIKDLKFADPNYHTNHFAEQFICDCYPLCDFNMYALTMDSGKLDRRFSLSDKRFFKDINITNHILLHVFYAELYGESLRLDVSENWLSFIGTFGGITGLHMGYSFVSGFEMIFFVFVRPACNWLTKKQIKYRINRRKKKQQLEQEKKRKLEMEKQEKERIEAYLRMRPYCPGY